MEFSNYRWKCYQDRDITIDFGNMEIICDFDKSSCNGINRTEAHLEYIKKKIGSRNINFIRNYARNEKKKKMRTIVGSGYLGIHFKDEIFWSIFVYANIHKNIYFIIFHKERKGEEKEKMGQGCLNVNSSLYRYRNEGKNNLVQFSSVAQLCPTLCDPMNCSTPGLHVPHELPELTQTHLH